MEPSGWRKHWACAKARLERNKIFFEFFSFVIIGSASIVFAWKADRILSSQETVTQQMLVVSKDNAELQLEAHLPTLDAKIDFDYGTRSRVLRITNDGDRLYNLTVLPFSFLQVSRIRFDHNDNPRVRTLLITPIYNEEGSAEIPFMGLFGLPSPGVGDGERGLLAQIRTNSNDPFGKDAGGYFDALKRGPDEMDAEIHCFVFLTYKDKYLKDYRQYFSFKPGCVGTGLPLDPEEGNRLLGRYNSGMASGYALISGHIDASEAVNIWKFYKDMPSILPTQKSIPLPTD